MKTTITLIITVVFAFNASAQSQWYAIAGISYYDDKVISLVDSGMDFKVGMGVELNETWGFEVCYDRAPSLGNEFDDFDDDPLEFKFEGNQYLSGLATYTFTAENDVAFIAKFGVVRGTREITIVSAQESDTVSDDETDGMLSLAVEFPVMQKHGIQLSVNNSFGDATEATSISAVFKLNF